MYNKCDKCSKQLATHEARKLIMDNNQNISTRCMDCYEQFQKVKS